MIRPLSDVAHAQVKKVGELESVQPYAKVSPGRLRRRAGSAYLLIVQFIERLLFVALLREDADVAVLWEQHIHEIDRFAAQVMVRENQGSIRAAVRQIRGVLDVDFANPRAHLRRLGKAPCNEFRLNALSVDGDRQVS